jgi:hypothetical protein
MKKASPAAKKALEAPSRVDPKKKQNEMSDMEKTRHMAATAGLKTKSPEQKRKEREQQAKNRMNRPNPEMLGNSTHTEEKDPALKRAGVSGFNKPKRTPGHPSSSHIVVTKINGKPKTIRFGQQGASTAGEPKKGESDKMKAKRKSFKARHAKNIAKGKSSAAYWADKEKW